MKKQKAVLFLFICLCGFCPVRADSVWHRVYSRQTAGDVLPLHPAWYIVYIADESMLKDKFNVFSKGIAEQMVELPLPNGTFRTFKIWRTSLLPRQLADKYPELETYNGVAVDNPNVTAKLDFTVYGFHAMIFDGVDISFVDPYSNFRDGYYTVHYKRDEQRQQDFKMNCLLHFDSANIDNILPVQKSSSGGLQHISNGYVFRSYRLALSCDHQYAQAVTGISNPSKAQVLSKMTTTLNRVNGIYERELSLNMVFVPNEDTLIFPSEMGDPFSKTNDDASGSLAMNQIIVDSFIGNSNYDIGHIFTTGAGGLSQLGVVCGTKLKAQSVTGSSMPTGDGFDVDYVAHEIGHEFGAQHTFNDNTSVACRGNAVEECAIEPGSGSTIMCYAGICNSDDLQPHSDSYFSGMSLIQMQKYITASADGCPIKSLTNNKLVNLPTFSTQYYIPCQTPFELTAPTAIDSVNDTSVTYCWEEWDLGDFGKSLSNTHVAGPIFRSYPPTVSTTRIFPNIKMVLTGTLSNAGIENASGEKVPDVPRKLVFRLTIRDIYNGNGCFIQPTDSILLDAVNTGSGFSITSQNTEGITYLGNTLQNITWNVAHTDAAPVNASTVDIYMSADSGQTWTYHIGTVPNTGSTTINIPNPDTSIPAARFKIKGTGNVFFNVNSTYFRVERNLESAIHIYPIPANSKLHIAIENSGVLEAEVFNSIGRCEWKGTINGQADLPAYLWARGVYFIKFVDSQTQWVVRKFVVD